MPKLILPGPTIFEKSISILKQSDIHRARFVKELFWSKEVSVHQIAEILLRDDLDPETTLFLELNKLYLKCCGPKDKVRQ